MDPQLPPERDGKTRELPVAAGAVISKGDIVIYNGTACIAASEGAGRDAYFGVGIATHSVTGGANDGDVQVEVRGGTFLIPNSDTTPGLLADIGDDAFAEGPRLASRIHNTNTRARIGTFFAVDADGVWVTI
jgi:hypothetical protein